MCGDLSPVQNSRVNNCQTRGWTKASRGERDGQPAGLSTLASTAVGQRLHDPCNPPPNPSCSHTHAPIDPATPCSNPLVINRVLIMAAEQRLCLMSHYIGVDIASVGLAGCWNWEMLCGMLQVVWVLGLLFHRFTSFMLSILFVPVQLHLLTNETGWRQWAQYVYICIADHRGRDDKATRQKKWYECFSHYITGQNSEFLECLLGMKPGIQLTDCWPYFNCFKLGCRWSCVMISHDSMKTIMLRVLNITQFGSLFPCVT